MPALTLLLRIGWNNEAEEKRLEMEAERCPICGQGALKKEVKDEVFEYGGSSITIPDYIVYRCNVCHEAIVDNETLKSSGHILKAFQREVDARRL